MDTEGTRSSFGLTRTGCAYCGCFLREDSTHCYSCGAPATVVDVTTDLELSSATYGNHYLNLGGLICRYDAKHARITERYGEPFETAVKKERGYFDSFRRPRVEPTTHHEHS